ncbi:hypothetical protein LBMAG53_11080 [Planctomycetota bacterium]|nr:hypothetical protein LBMAG53_11080 [Planctomycetota bacterium]
MVVEDERLLSLAVERGWITSEEIARVRSEQQALSDRGIEHSLWFLVLDLGLVSDEQARELRKSVSSTRVTALEVSGFLLQGRLGSGGMGDVFRARHPDGRIGAVKLLATRLSRSEENRRRFAREARAGLRLSHPHIVPVWASGEVDHTPYLVMELVEGGSLKQRISDRGPLSEGEAVVLLRQMGQALAHAWRHGVLHRDIKPANIILGAPRTGVLEPFCARLCDFGLAKVWQEGSTRGEDPESIGGLTGAGLALGTPHYMSPEQAAGETDLDQRADMYGLGATLYHALLGQTLFNGKSSAVIMYKQVTEAPDLAALSARGIHPALLDLIGRLLAKERKQRPADWEAVLAEAERLAVPTLALAPAPPLAAPAKPPAGARQRAVAPAISSAASGTVPQPSAQGVVKQAPVQSTAAPPAQSPPPQAQSSPQALSSPQAQSAPSIAPRALPSPQAQLAPRRSKRRLWPWAIGIIAITAIGGSAVAAFGQTGSTLATPQSLPALLSRSHGDLSLQPGIYAGPWHFGAAASGTALRAGGPGVILRGPVVCEPGLRNCSLTGVRIDPDPASGLAVEVLTGAALTLHAVEVNGGLAIAGELSGYGLEIQGAIRASNDSRLRLERSRINAAVTADHADLRLLQVRCSGSGAPTMLTISGGRTELDGVVISGGGVGLRVDGADAVRLTDVAITATATALSAEHSALTAIDGLDLTAPTGLAWNGPRDPGWSWKRLKITAETPATGLEPVTAAQGARAERLP